MAFIFWGDEQRFHFFCITDKNMGIVRATLKSNYILSLAFHSEMSAKVFTFVCYKNNKLNRRKKIVVITYLNTISPVNGIIPSIS